MWKWGTPASNTLLFWKLRGELVRIKSIHVGFSGFLKQVFGFIKVFKLWTLMKLDRFFSYLFIYLLILYLLLTIYNCYCKKIKQLYIMSTINQSKMFLLKHLNHLIELRFHDLWIVYVMQNLYSWGGELSYPDGGYRSIPRATFYFSNLSL